MRTLLHPAREEMSLPVLLYALGDPLRLSIVAQLAQANEQMSCGEFFVSGKVAKSTLSHHFKVLREAGLIRMVQRGRRLMLSLRSEELELCFPSLLESILHIYHRS